MRPTTSVCSIKPQTSIQPHTPHVSPVTVNINNGRPADQDQHCLIGKKLFTFRFHIFFIVATLTKLAVTRNRVF